MLEETKGKAMAIIPSLSSELGELEEINGNLLTHFNPSLVALMTSSRHR